MSTVSQTLSARISAVERVRLRNGTKLVLLTLDVPYLQAMRFTGSDVTMSVISGGAGTTVEGQLGLSNLLDSPACVGVSSPELGKVAIGDRFVFERTGTVA
jgi:hypothetical protein